MLHPMSRLPSPRLQAMTAVTSKLLVCAVCLLCGIGSATADKRNLLLRNDYVDKVNLFWVDPNTRATILMNDPGGIVPGEEFPLNTFVGHEFEIQEIPVDGSCPNAPNRECRSAQFQISEHQEQSVFLTSDFEAVFVDTQINARFEAGQLVASCAQKAKRKLNQGVPASAPSAATASANSPDQILQELTDCVQAGVATALERVQQEIAFQAAVRTDIAHMLENYTCLDDTLESTPDVDTRVWHHKEDAPRTVHIKHERPASSIHLIENFINEAECIAMEEAAKKSLHRATVADGKGGSRLSENRKAMQAGITVEWDKEADGDPIAVLSRRVYDYTNYVLGLDIDEFGQEDLMSIQYFGRGANDTTPDRYTPHCDGECVGMPHKSGSRMATLVMYCETAKRGGHTNFRNAGVHIKPAVGAGIFFSYINPETLVMDTGYTEHSGCPVFEGNKKIVTQWVRLGVDNENPWDSFNTLGMKKSEIIIDW